MFLDEGAGIVVLQNPRDLSLGSISPTKHAQLTMQYPELAFGAYVLLSEGNPPYSHSTSHLDMHDDEYGDETVGWHDMGYNRYDDDDDEYGGI